MISIVAAAALGCERKPERAPGGPCTLSLATHCKSGGCESFSVRAAELRAEVARHVASGSCLARASIGSCGAFRYVESSDGYQGKIDYFDAAGEHVAAELFSDMGYCDGGSARATAGPVPSCTRVASETLCPRADASARP